MKAGRVMDARVAEKVRGKSVVWVTALHAYRPRDGSTVLDDMVPEYVQIPVEAMGEDDVVLYWTAECGTPNQYVPEEIERYSTDMRAAWDVVSDFDPAYAWEFEVLPDGSAWAKVYGHTQTNDCESYRAHAETMPLAICLAALKAVGAEVPA